MVKTETRVQKVAVFPSKEWVERVLEATEKNNAYKKATRHWNGDFLCIGNGDEEFLRELGRKEVMEGFISFVNMIPPERRTRYKGTPTGNVFETLGIPFDAFVENFNADEALRKASKLSIEDIRAASVYIWVDFWHGAVRNLVPVVPGEHEDVTFKLSGDYSAWKLLVSGKQDPIVLILRNKLKVETYMSHMPNKARLQMMRNMKAGIALAKELFASVPVE